MRHPIECREPLRHRPQALLSDQVQRGEFFAQDGDVGEISLYDEIGYWGVTAADFRRVLNGVGSDRIVLNVNSPGGDVFDGIAMYNDLVSHPANVTVRVTGLAASAASIVAMAGDRIEIAGNGFLMIHDAWGVTVGNKQEMREFADVLEAIDGALAQTYTERTGVSADDIVAMMRAETWLTGSQAVESGFADATFDGSSAQALFDLSVYAKTPPGLKRDIENGLRKRGYSRNEALVAVASGFSSLRDAGDRDQRDAETEESLGRLLASIKAAF